mgnify:CR=1 FL=1
MEKIHLYDKIISPLVTEKSTNLSEQNKIVFKVPSSANKTILKSGSDSQIADYFTYSPVTFITEVGLYNSSNQLLAVATLNKPIAKTPADEVTIVASIDG